MYKCVETNSPIDLLLGMKCYVSSSKGVEVLEKIDSSNFTVREVIKRYEIASEPYYLKYYSKLNSDQILYLFILKKRELETFEAIKRVRKILRARDIYYLGLKDKAATTYQFIGISNPKNFSPYVYTRDFELFFIDLINKSMFRRDILLGNCFSIDLSRLVRDFESRKESIHSMIETLKNTGFIPNYYSYQRFGVRRVLTHLVGRHILRNDLQRALHTLICYPEEECDIRDHCKEILESKKRWMWIERSVCKAFLSKLTLREVFKKIPRAINLLFIESYFSYLFNNYLSERWRLYGLGFENIDDEKLDKTSLTRSVCPYISIELSNRELNVTSGSRDILYELLEKDFDRELSRSFDMVRYLTGLNKILVKRFLICPLTSLEIRGSYLELCLDKGCYATILLRELFKENTIKLF
ncbi:MAG: tRNA pseudouridine(13) synthase TruD [Sulfolobales archaeon]